MKKIQVGDQEIFLRFLNEEDVVEVIAQGKGRKWRGRNLDCCNWDSRSLSKKVLNPKWLGESQPLPNGC